MQANHLHLQHQAYSRFQRNKRDLELERHQDVHPNPSSTSKENLSKYEHGEHLVVAECPAVPEDVRRKQGCSLSGSVLYSTHHPQKEELLSKYPLA